MTAMNAGRRGPIADINVTPLVDVVLVLLIVFMVAAEVLADEESSIPIDLPAANTAEVSKTEPLTVAVTADGRYLLGGRYADQETVATTVQDAVASRGPSLEVVVSADRRASHERFVALLDLLRGQGVTRFAIQTSLPSPGGAGG